MDELAGGERIWRLQPLIHERSRRVTRFQEGSEVTAEHVILIIHDTRKRLDTVSELCSYHILGRRTILPD